MLPKDAETTLEQRSLDGDSEEKPRLALIWLSPEAPPRTTWLEGANEFVVGRESSSDVWLPGRLLSRRHARLFRTGSAWFIEDLESRNGVSINDEMAARASIAPGDVLRLGSWLGLVHEFERDELPAYELFAEGLFGGPDLAALMQQVRLAAASDVSVVLEGATGTGKEQLARAIHRQSGRSGDFLAINCAVYQNATAAAELFGYRKGAFTGAERAHPGLIRAAEGGTLLLDEIADLSPEVQAQLLRAIENRELIPLGEARALPANVRFLAATQKPLGELVDAGKFRPDLRARLEGMRLRIPPLRERRGDVPFLFLHLLRQLSAAPPLPDVRVLERLCLYDWPLNVREMVTLVRRLLAAYPGEKSLTVAQVQREFPELESSSPSAAAPANAPRTRRDARAFDPKEVALLMETMERHAGNLTRAAAELNMSRQRAYRMMKSQSR